MFIKRIEKNEPASYIVVEFKKTEMKIYTKTGDAGTTALYGGKRLSKAELRIEAYGTVDEVNSFLGMVTTYMKRRNIPTCCIIYKAGYLISEHILPQNRERKI